MANLILVKSLEDMVHVPPVRIEGWITVELIDARTGIIKRALRFRNIYTNAGLDVCSVSTSSSGPLYNVQYAGVGTGSTAPAVTDTTLVAEIAAGGRTNANGGFADTFGYVAGPPDYVWMKMTRLFTETQANGNLTEIGFFNAATGGTMSVRQLFKDGAGTPITITKTSADQLRVTYEMRGYPPAGDTALPNITLDGVVHTPTLRAVNVDVVNAAWMHQAFYFLGRTSAGKFTGALETDVLSPRTGASNIAGTQSNTVTVDAYTAGNFYLDKTDKWEPSTANFATGIGSISDGGDITNRPFQIKFAPKINKTNVKRLTLVLRQSWARYP